MRIEELAHLRDDKRIRFTDEEVNGETVTIVSYMIGEPCLWAIPNAIECRGIVFNSDGDCISRPFHKFFNVGENEQTQPHVLEGMELEVLDKRDGSMLVPVLVGGEIAWKTKKSFYSDVAVEASKHVTETLNFLAKSLIHLGFTPIFEYTSPFNRVVLDYGSEHLFTLLAVRETLSGEYVSYELLKEMTNEIGVPLIMRKSLSLKECMEISALLEGEEGWCLRDVSTGFYCKQKTEWYLRNHRARTELRERDVADMVVEETIDDIKSALCLDGFDLSPVEAIEHRVVTEISSLRAEVEELYASLPDKQDFKQIALTYRHHVLFSLLIAQARGKEPDYTGPWKRHFRDKYSLICVYNRSF